MHEKVKYSWKQFFMQFFMHNFTLHLFSTLVWHVHEISFMFHEDNLRLIHAEIIDFFHAYIHKFSWTTLHLTCAWIFMHISYPLTYHWFMLFSYTFHSKWTYDICMKFYMNFIYIVVHDIYMNLVWNLKLLDPLNIQNIQYYNW